MGRTGERGGKWGMLQLYHNLRKSIKNSMAQYVKFKILKSMNVIFY